MKEPNITRITLEEADVRRRAESLTDWDRVRNAPDPDWDPEEDFVVDWSSAVLVTPEPKTPVSLRIDADVLEYFRAQGKGYQTRMNAVLRAYVMAQKAG